MMTDIEYGGGFKVGDFTALYWTNIHEDNPGRELSIGFTKFFKFGGGFFVVIDM